MAVESIMNISTISVGMALVVVLVTLVYYSLKDRDLPPGPWGLPFFGYWPFLNNQTCYKKMEALKKKYGDVFCFRSVGRLYINLGSHKAIREAHVAKSDCFAGRCNDFNLLSFMFADGVGFVNGEPWKELRKFFVQVMKERGLISVKDSMSGSMYDAIKGAVQEIKEKNGEPINIIELVTNKCSTILHRMLFGENDKGVTEEQIRQINELYLAEMEIITVTNLLLTGNFARYFIWPFVKGFGKAMNHHSKILEILFKVVNEHKSTYSEDHVRDIIDDYFKERDNRRSKGDPTAKYFTDKALVSSLEQFVGDGVLSVATFICMIIKILLDYPEEERKVYEEILQVVGQDREPTIEDKSKLPYTNAFILEALRTSEFFGFFPSLECSRETTLRGYRIPKGAITVMNVSLSHFDPDVYEEPRKFNPSRYLTKEGRRRPELPLTFGMGKRACIGEAFTMMQVFLFLTTVIKNFHLTLPEGVVTDNFDDLFSGKLRITAQSRNQK